MMDNLGKFQKEKEQFADDNWRVIDKNHDTIQKIRFLETVCK